MQTLLDGMYIGYRPFIISTIVDSQPFNGQHLGYRPFIISTIVDYRRARFLCMAIGLL